jgi:hypothetical protein
VTEARICGVQLTPTHAGETALVVELLFENGGRSKVQIDATFTAKVLERAGVGVVQDLVGLPWRVLDVSEPKFIGDY